MSNLFGKNMKSKNNQKKNQQTNKQTIKTKQYFSYIVAVSLLVEEAEVPGETTNMPRVTDNLW